MRTDAYKEIEDGIEYSIVENPFFKNWYLNGKRHRLKGPAIQDLLSDEEPINGAESLDAWYYNGEEVPCKTQEEFEHWIKLKIFW